MKKNMKRNISALLCVVLSLGLIACAGNKDGQGETDDVISTLPISEEMKSVFHTKEIVNETVMFMSSAKEATLLYTPDEIISVTSYDGKTTYKEGTDYKIQDGKLVLPEGSAIPCIDKSEYYPPVGEIFIGLIQEDNTAGLYWGDKDTMTKWQICINYTHSETWDGYKQKSYSDRYAKFLKKLKDGEDVTVQFYGDDITAGANSSIYAKTDPGRYPYTVLFLQTLAEIFDYTVTFANSRSGAFVPEEDLQCGSRGTITCVNNSVLDYTSQQALDDFEILVEPNLGKYGCDLFVLAFGIKDLKMTGKESVDIQKEIVDSVLASVPDTDILLVSTMVPHLLSSKDDMQDEQEKELLSIAEQYNGAESACAVACMTSVSQSIYKMKEYRDCTGNNLDQPNDFLHRIYAQTLFQTVLGYENAADMIVSE